MNDRFRAIFDAQQANRWRVAGMDAGERVARLRKLRRAILDRRPDLHRALLDDFRKNPCETDLTEVYPTIEEIDAAIRHLPKWMKPRRPCRPIALPGARYEIRCEPRGLVLVLSPWNYPFNLSMNPVVAALAAGNCVVLKPSSKVPATAAFLADLLGSVFDPLEVAVVQGGHDVSDALLELPFDHVFFTGSPPIGRRVMAAAAKHLATVTLELGGKSPAIVDAGADLRVAAERILWGKFVNAGQTCIAPDYLLIDARIEDAFLDEARKVLAERYGATDADREASESFCRIVTRESWDRLRALLDRAVASGAKVETGGTGDRETRYLAPTIVTGVTCDSPLMEEELFGPILPVVRYGALDEALAFVRSRDKPLALYVFTNDHAVSERVIAETSAGGSCVNSVILQVANPAAPFGGVGTSGMGHYHGEHGFRELSHERTVVTQGWPDTLKDFYPPYTDRTSRRIDKVLK